MPLTLTIFGNFAELDPIFQDGNDFAVVQTQIIAYLDAINRTVSIEDYSPHFFCLLERPHHAKRVEGVTFELFLDAVLVWSRTVTRLART